ncbi:MAG: nucleoside-diphosphate sugar epimerase/dehydratase [Pseudomonadota bacterium]
MNTLSRRKRQVIALLLDAIVLPAALWSAFVLRLGELNPDVGHFWPAFVVCVLIAIPAFVRLGLYRQVIRYMGVHAMRTVIQGTAIAALAVAITPYMFHLDGFPRSVPIIFWMLALCYVAGSRFAVRAYINRRSGRAARSGVLIFGAGKTGVELARLMVQQGEYQPVAFLDDDVRWQRSTIDGIYVYGRDDLPRLLRESTVNQVFVALSDAQARRNVVEFLAQFSVRVRLVPDIAGLVSGQQSLAKLQDVSIEDLLGRDEVEGLPHLLEQQVVDANVLVTGAGGSIGSELCRQILRLRPKTLVLLEQSEFGIYEIQRELEAKAEEEGLPAPLIAVLGTVLDTALLQRTMRRYRIHTVYHAAAYKHVSLVENNVIQGLKNNTFGTLYAAQAAMDCGVKHFILISTDKAVRTSSVMGASKRLAEMVLQALQEESHDTCFSMVRFGNVLGSSGSVVPLFNEQIECGGPVTVTHPEVTRYFMSIPEAAQLVLQASALARGGDVFLLDMGQPIKIVDLARRMIHLQGLTVKDEDHPSGDIEIVFTGLKPGEKLHEELLLGGDVTGTEHRKIMRARESSIPWTELRGALYTLEEACATFDYDAVMRFIQGLVDGGDLEAQLGELFQVAEVVHLPVNKSSD